MNVEVLPKSNHFQKSSMASQQSENVHGIDPNAEFDNNEPSPPKVKACGTSRKIAVGVFVVNILVHGKSMFYVLLR